MDKICANFTKNLLKFCTFFSESFRNILFDEIHKGVENNFNKFWSIIYKNTSWIFEKISEKLKENLRKILKTVENNFRKCCTNLSKFVKIVSDTYLNFTKLLNISKIFWKASTKFQKVTCKTYANFIHNLIKFLKNFFKNFQNFREVFPNISVIFFQKFQEILLKTNTFL